MDIIKNRKIYIAISAVLIIIGLAFMVINKVQGNGIFNYDVQFTGGTSFEVNIGKDFSNDDVLKVVQDNTGAKSPQIQKLGDGNSVMIKVQSLESETRTKLVKALCEKFGIEEKAISVEDVSATVSGEMKRSAMLAVTVSCIAMLIYVTIRFRDFKIGLSSILALVHDALIVLGCYAVFRIPLNNSFIAAILTVLGYSINATIIIFDRLRENRKGIKDRAEVVNLSVNKSIKRSLFTSLTTFFTIFSLYILGVPSVKEFALPIVVGIICGTYSSIFIAGSIWYILSGIKSKKA